MDSHIAGGCLTILKSERSQYLEDQLKFYKILNCYQKFATEKNSSRSDMRKWVEIVL